MAYLAAKAPDATRVEWLPFEGANQVVFTPPAAAAAAAAAMPQLCGPPPWWDERGARTPAAVQ